MPEYRWVCLACNKPNDSSSRCCAFCGCPVDDYGTTVELWDRAEGKPPKMPSANGMMWPFGRMTVETENCPHCRLHMYLSDRQCPHCGFVQDLDQRHDFFSSYHAKRDKAWKQGAVLFSVFIVVAALLFHWFGLGI